MRGVSKIFSETRGKRGGEGGGGGERDRAGEQREKTVRGRGSAPF